MSGIGWVDFSSEHRERVKSVLDALSTPGVIDELGIGAIRDTFADALFPGISTIQTRAIYFLTVPRILNDFQKLPPRDRKDGKLVGYLNDVELRCRNRLVEAHPNSGEESGIIGRSFHGKNRDVQRKPSSIYWTGLRRFRLVDTKLSLQTFCRKFANPNAPLRDVLASDSSQTGDDADAEDSGRRVINIPDYDDDWIAQLQLRLSRDEATFLSSQIAVSVPDSLLGRILANADLRTDFLRGTKDGSFRALAGDQTLMNQFPVDLQQLIRRARDFWQLLHGAHIRYNCLVQEHCGTAEKRDEFLDQWEQWRTEIAGFPWGRWKTDQLWDREGGERTRIPAHTRTFVREWIEFVRDNASEGSLDDLVRMREICMKTRRARLRETVDTSVADWVGLDVLNYRLGNARSIIDDIDAGLTARGASDA